MVSLKGCQNCRGVTREMTSVQDVINLLSNIRRKINDEITLGPEDIPFVMSLDGKKYLYGAELKLLESWFRTTILYDVNYNMKEHCSDKILASENDRLKEENKKLYKKICAIHEVLDGKHQVC